MEVMATIRQEPVVAKKIYLHKNGLKGHQPKMLVVNERHVRDFSSFLNRVTSGIKAPVAVRSIYTPVGGRKINRLEDLQNGKHYVAGGNEHFKKLRYDRYSNPLQKQTQRLHIVEGRINLPPLRTVQAASRFRNLPEKPYSIHVFRNGDALFKGVRVLLPRRLMNSWEHILEIVTDKAELTLPAKRLCTLEGQVIHSVTDIKDGEKYVALEGARRFIKLPYNSIEPLPKPTNRRLHIRMRRMTSTLTSTDTTTLPLNTTLQSTDDQPKIKRLMPIKQHKGVERPFAGHKNKAARNRALRYAQTDSAFGVENKVPGTVTDAPVVPVANTSITSEGDTTTEELVEDATFTMENRTETLEEEIVEDTSTLENDTTLPQPVMEASYESVQETSVDVKQDIEDDDDVIDQAVAGVTGNETDEEPKMSINGTAASNGGITELQGVNPNENVDLSVARKTQQEDGEERQPDTTKEPGVNSTHSLTSNKLPSTHSSLSKVNTPLNAASKSSLKVKPSSKTVSRTSSKKSTRSIKNPKTPVTPPTNNEVVEDLADENNQEDEGN